MTDDEDPDAEDHKPRVWTCAEEIAQTVGLGFLWDEKFLCPMCAAVLRERLQAVMDGAA